MTSVSEIVDGVHRFDGNGTNVYVITGDDGRMTVVDAGLPGHWGPFSAWLHRTGSNPHDIDAVLITHSHADHIGFAPRAQEHGADLRIHEDDLAAVQGGGSAAVPERFARNAWRPGVLARLGGWARRGVGRTPTLREVRPCEDGEVLDVPGQPRVMHVPGHTPGSAAYVFDDLGIVCSGDALVTVDPVTRRPGIGVSPTGLNADDAQALASLDHFASVEDESIILPGHGEPWHHGIGGALSAARAIGADW